MESKIRSPDRVYSILQLFDIEYKLLLYEKANGWYTLNITYQQGEEQQIIMWKRNNRHSGVCHVIFCPWDTVVHMSDLPSDTNST